MSYYLSGLLVEWFFCSTWCWLGLFMHLPWWEGAAQLGLEVLYGFSLMSNVSAGWIGSWHQVGSVFLHMISHHLVV